MFNMAAISKRRERKRVPYDISNNLISVDLSVYDEKGKKIIFKDNIRNLPGGVVDSKKRGRGWDTVTLGRPHNRSLAHHHIRNETKIMSSYHESV
jgi:hypothetical protein